MNCFHSLIFLGSLVITNACQTASEGFEVTALSVAPGEPITWLGEKTVLSGSGMLQIGAKFPEVHLIDNKMQSVAFNAIGQVSIISSIPSIDTPVCDQQAHILSEDKTLSPQIARVIISLDLPYAQRRFAEQTKLTNIDFYSDYREQQFAKSTGLQIQRNGLLARSVIVVDSEGIIRHRQVVPEITQMPDMKKAFTIANQLIELKSTKR